MRPSILIVDDESANRRLVRAILEPLGYALREASDGQEALDRVKEFVPDLVLLDVIMPRMDGYETCRRLKADPPTRLVPVVMLTSLNMLPDKLKAIEIGVDDFLLKPFNSSELVTRVRSLLSLKRFTDELEHASRVLETLARVIEARDRYTGDHCARLSTYARGVGRVMNMGEEDLRILHLGGVFHDLGKVAVPDGILNKPGRLTEPAEFDILRRHPAAGADICRGMRSMEPVTPLIRHHHERLDGSGYPDGLKGKEIPLPVRIISVVDVYDALATRRPYKEAIPRESCFAIMREEIRKGWWDRDVVEALEQAVGT